MVEGNMGKLEVRSVYSNPEKNSCLNACLFFRSCYDVFKNLKTPNRFAKFSFAKGLAMVKLGGVVDGS